MITHKRYATFAWVLVAYTIAVILWGAYVRATGSGAGCGAHWPTCNGAIIPRAESVETLIEFTHRLMSALYGFLVLGLVFGAFRLFPKGSIVRKGAVLTLVFTIIESLLGAGLVLFELVAYNVSVERAFAAALHLVNTNILLGCATLTAWWASGKPAVRVRGEKTAVTLLLFIGLIAMLVVSAFGAITALGDTIFRPETLAAGLEQKQDPAAHFLIQLRVWHPVLAVVTSLYLLYVVGYLTGERPSPDTRRFGRMMQLIIVVQLAAGVLNILLLVPVWMQIVHLLLADLLWIAQVLFSASALAVTKEMMNEEGGRMNVPDPSIPAPR